MLKNCSTKEQTAAMLCAALAVSFWGASFTATKVAVNEVSPIILLWLRFGIGSLVLGTLLIVRGKMKLLPLRDIFDFAMLGLIGIFLHNFIQSTGLKTASAGVSALIVASTPIMIAILGAVFLSEALQIQQVIGVLLAASGVVLVVTDGHLSVLLDHSGNSGELLVTCSVFTWAVFSVISRNKLGKYLPSLAMFYVMFSGWIFISITLMVTGNALEVPRLSFSGWSSVIFLGVFCSALAYLLWYSALRKLPASRVGIFMYLSPLVGVAVAALVLSEPVGLWIISGGIMVLAGMGLVNSGKSV